MTDRENEDVGESRLDGAFERRAKEMFDRSTAELDASTRSRLTQARYRALEELPKNGRRRGWRWSLVPVGAVAAAVLVAVLVLGPNNPARDLGTQVTALADLEILLGEEDLEMYDEEIEFYAWLEEQPEFTPAATGDGVG